MSSATEQPRRNRRGIFAIVVLALGLATIMQATGWAQTSNYALVRALSHGTAKIDAYHWDTRDESYYRGHYYSVKAPGMALLALPPYEALKLAGAKSLSQRMALKAKRGGGSRWYPGGAPKPDQYGNDIQRAKMVRGQVQGYTPLVWMLGLFTTLIPALLLLLLVRACANRLEPGLGTATAITLGAGTLVMPFATLFFSHVLSALLGFACFALLWKERERAPRLSLVAVAGLLGGYAITCEYPLAIVAAICGVYAISRGDLLRRSAAYAGGVVVGVSPLILYNLLAFGSIGHNSYVGAVKEQGLSGHDVLGSNDAGFFGIGVPSLHAAFDLLLSSKGLFVLSPVLIMGVVGTFLLYRRSWRAEALVIAGIASAFLIYNSGYWLPFGGGSPGPRFLIPILPFVALPIALALRRFPSTTLALAIPSVLAMTTATVALPMIGNGDTGFWLHALELGSFEHTIPTIFGADNGWLALSPVLILLAVAIGLTAASTPRLNFSRDASVAVAAIIGWTVVAAIAPTSPEIASGKASHDFMPVILVAAATSLLSITAAVAAERRPWARRLTEAPDTAG